MRFSKGFSLIEMLVVVAIFASVALILSQSTVFSLRGAKKSDTSSRVRDNLSFAMTVMDRHLRNAQSLPSCVATPQTSLNYIDADGNPSAFYCVNEGPNGYIASGSSALSDRITSDQVSVTACSFVCDATGVGLPPQIKISLTGEDRLAAGTEEKSPITLETQVNLRTY